MLSAYFQVAKPEPTTLGEVQEALFADLSPAQVVSLERFLATIRRTGRCVIVTDSGRDADGLLRGRRSRRTRSTCSRDYLAAGGVLVFSTDTAFDWFYARLLRPLIVRLGPRSRLLANALLILSGGTEIFVFQDGALPSHLEATRDSSGGFDVLIAKERRVDGMPALDPASTMYIGDSVAPSTIDHAMADRVGIVIDVGDAMLGVSSKPIFESQARLPSNNRRDRCRNCRPCTSPDGRHSRRSCPRSAIRCCGPSSGRTSHRDAASAFASLAAASCMLVSPRPDGWDPVYNVRSCHCRGGYEASCRPGMFTFF